MNAFLVLQHESTILKNGEGRDLPHQEDAKCNCTVELQTNIKKFGKASVDIYSSFSTEPRLIDRQDK